MKRWINRLRRHSRTRHHRLQTELDGALAAQEARNIDWVVENMQVDTGPNGELLHHRGTPPSTAPAVQISTISRTL